MRKAVSIVALALLSAGLAVGQPVAQPPTPSGGAGKAAPPPDASAPAAALKQEAIRLKDTVTRLEGFLNSVNMEMRAKAAEISHLWQKVAELERERSRLDSEADAARDQVLGTRPHLDRVQQELARLGEGPPPDRAEPKGLPPQRPVPNPMSAVEGKLDAILKKLESLEQRVQQLERRPRQD